jgi:hypothetical protein
MLWASREHPPFRPATLTTRKPPYTRTIPLAKVAELADALA